MLVSLYPYWLERCYSFRAFICFALFLFCSAVQAQMPEELRTGLINFEIERDNYLDALTLMSENDKKANPANYGAALLYYLGEAEEAESYLVAATEDPKKLSPHDRFRLGKAFFSAGQCIDALKAFKPLKNRIIPELKQEWAYYRSECFLTLRSKQRAAQVLLDTVSGLWVAHAYYNLAMEHNKSTLNKNNALKALLAAADINPNKNLLERELSDRIYYAMGTISLQENLPEQAERFFRKINLESNIAAQALYMNGVIKLKLKDFRAATQSWMRTKKYPTIVPGAAESLLAIPYAYEGSGYKAQAIESYLDAGRIFEKELINISKVIESIEKYGVKKVLIEENKIEGLEWFLALDVPLNTKRAAFYSYLSSDPVLYDVMAKLMELFRVDDRLALWEEQLETFISGLNSKTSAFSRSSKKFNLKAAQAEYERIEKLIKSFEARGLDQVAMDDLKESASQLKVRINETKSNLGVGKKHLKSLGQRAKKLLKSTKVQRNDLEVFIDKYQSFVDRAALKKMEELKAKISAHYERSQQGLIHILEAIAESRALIDSDFDGSFRP